MAQLFLGVDGGGTKCRMRLTDHNQNILGEATILSPSNLQVGDGDGAYRAISELTKLVYAKAGLDLKQAANTHACFGMAGARLLSSRQRFAARIFPFATTSVVDDIDIARAGAHLGHDGAVLIIGTGSAGLGQVDGKRYQIGGWGFLIGDTMSGAVLGRQLLRQSLLAFEGLERSSPLTKAVMEKFDNQPDKLMAWSFSNPRALGAVKGLRDQDGLPDGGIAHARPSDYGDFVPMIFDYIERDDVVAKQLLEFELAAIDQFVQWFLQRDIKSIAIVGGLGQRLLPTLQNIYPGLIVKPKSSPLQGAIILAAKPTNKTTCKTIQT